MINDNDLVVESKKRERLYRKYQHILCQCREKSWAQSLSPLELKQGGILDSVMEVVHHSWMQLFNWKV